MHINVQFIPSTWTLFGGSFDCQHMASHQEEVISTYWNSELENSQDFEGTIAVCDECDEVLGDGCEL